MVKEKIRYIGEYEFTYIDSPIRKDKVNNRRWKRRTDKQQIKKELMDELMPEYKPCGRYKSNIRDRIAYDESTRDPIFLLQKKIYIPRGDWDCVENIEEWDEDTDEPLQTNEWCEYGNCEGEVYSYEEKKWLSEEELEDREMLQHYWETESVWLTREEAEDFLKRTSYNFGGKDEKGRVRKGRVYCVCCEGELAKMFREFDFK